MSDLIDRQAAEDIVYFECGEWRGLAKTIIHSFEVLPTAERKGHWQITEAYPHNVYCSECHTKYAQTHWAVWEDGSLPRTYCPNCGARMGVI